MLPLLCSCCRLRKELCVCGLAPALTSDVRILLLTHERERDKITNTGRLLERSLTSCDVHIWQRKHSGIWLLDVARRLELQPVLLFPRYDQKLSLTGGDEISSNRQPWFIIIDATWQQARKMIRQSPELQMLPRLVLDVDEPSQYSLRKNQQAGQVSTVETGVLLLQYLQQQDEAEQLNQYFHQFLSHFEAHRSQHSLV